MRTQVVVVVAPTPASYVTPHHCLLPYVNFAYFACLPSALQLLPVVVWVPDHCFEPTERQQPRHRSRCHDLGGRQAIPSNRSINIHLSALLRPCVRHARFIINSTEKVGRIDRCSRVHKPHRLAAVFSSWSALSSTFSLYFSSSFPFSSSLFLVLSLPSLHFRRL